MYIMCNIYISLRKDIRSVKLEKKNGNKKRFGPYTHGKMEDIPLKGLKKRKLTRERETLPLLSKVYL